MFPPEAVNASELAAAAPVSHPNTLSLSTQDMSADIRRAALYYLARREYSQQELINKMVQKFKRLKKQQLHTPVSMVTVEQIEAVVAAISAEGLQSDSRYMDMLIRGRTQQGHGPVRIAQELKQKGLQPSDFEVLLDSSGEHWLAHAQQVRERKFGSKQTSNQQQKAKQMRFLQYRGFSGEQIRAAFSLAQ